MGRTKGSHVISSVKVLRSQRERALKLLPPKLHKYLEERVLVSSWYPLEDHIGLLRAVVALMPPVGGEPYNFVGRAAARLDLGGVYRNHLRPGDGERSLEVLGAMWRSVHDTGEATSTVEAPRRVRVRVSKFDGTCAEVCAITGGYLEEIVLIATHKKARVVHEQCRLKGHGECAWLVTWDAG